MSNDTEYVSVTGAGRTRDEALTEADGLAREWFGDGVSLVRTVGRASPETTRLSPKHSVRQWLVEVEYRRAGLDEV